jgi:hypothetical protein
MIKAIRSSDLWVIAGLAIVVFSARLAAGTLPRISEWVSEFTGDSPADGSADADTPDEDSSSSAIESPNSSSPASPIIVMPPSNQPSEPPKVCPASKRAG